MKHVENHASDILGPLRDVMQIQCLDVVTGMSRNKFIRCQSCHYKRAFTTNFVLIRLFDFSILRGDNESSNL